jgi:hypothetical protein
VYQGLEVLWPFLELLMPFSHYLLVLNNWFVVHHPHYVLLTCYPTDTGCAHFANVVAADVKEEPDTIVKHKETFLPLLESKEKYSTGLQKELRLFPREEQPFKAWAFMQV